MDPVSIIGGVIGIVVYHYLIRKLNNPKKKKDRKKAKAKAKIEEAPKEMAVKKRLQELIKDIEEEINDIEAQEKNAENSECSGSGALRTQRILDPVLSANMDPVSFIGRVMWIVVAHYLKRKLNNPKKKKDRKKAKAKIEEAPKQMASDQLRRVKKRLQELIKDIEKEIKDIEAQEKNEHQLREKPKGTGGDVAKKGKGGKGGEHVTDEQLKGKKKEAAIEEKGKGGEGGKKGKGSTDEQLKRKEKEEKEAAIEKKGKGGEGIRILILSLFLFVLCFSSLNLSITLSITFSLFCTTFIHWALGEHEELAKQKRKEKEAGTSN